MPKIKLSDVTNVTLYTGDNSPWYCTCSCPCCSQRKREQHYQGEINQGNTLFNMLPNLKQLYIFGNPDPSVDTDFCHQIALMAMSKGIHVCISTSGIGGKYTYQRLLKGIPTSIVDYVSVSIDTVDEEKLCTLKGRKYSLMKSVDGINWLLSNGYNVKIQPTLWSSNFLDVEELMEYFIHIGVYWFTFHIGSLESGISLPTHGHLTSDELKNVHETIQRVVNRHKNKITVRCPIIYPELWDNDESKWYCMKEFVSEIMVTFTKKGIKGTHVPMSSLFNENLSFYFEEGRDVIELPTLEKKDICPISKELSGKSETICRYVSRYWYPQKEN